MKEFLRKDSSKDVRASSIAGLWYDNSPDRLSTQIDAYLSTAKPPSLGGEIIALIAPHAGYIYSGRTAGHAYRAVQGSRKDLVVVASPLHPFHPAGLLTSGHSAYTTPLGDVFIQQEAVQQVEGDLAKAGLTLTHITHDTEHSLEIQLPFLQRALAPGFQLLPIMVRDHNPQTCETLGKALARAVSGRQVLLVASTDLSHHYPERIARALDDEMLRQIENFSPDGVLEAERTGAGFACGAAAVASVLYAARALGADMVKILHYSTSADETGDRSAVVGYGAAAILKTS